MKKILYVEDDPDQITLMNYFFKRYVTNAELLTFKNGIEFFDFLQQLKQFKENSTLRSCCILLDINLPYLNGYEILERVKAYEDNLIRDLPVVMFSSSHRRADQEKSLTLGAVSYLQKPLDYNEMKTILEFLLSQIPL